MPRVNGRRAPRAWRFLGLGAVTLAALVSTQLRAAAGQGALSTGGSSTAVSFTTAQAERGRVAYARSCAGCHGDALHGDEGREVPPLEGPAFVTSWNGQPAADFVSKIQRTMPADAPGSLRAADVAAIAAFVLRANGVADGSRDLPDDPMALDGLVLRLAGTTR